MLLFQLDAQQVNIAMYVLTAGIDIKRAEHPKIKIQ